MRAAAITILSTTHTSARRGDGFALDSAKTGVKKFFWISSLNRTLADRIPIGIARIARKAIRASVASRDREDERRARNRRPMGSHRDDSEDVSIACTALDVVPQR